ncbi:MAG: helicase-exonuclease AddAB subunit AddB [Clostridia bacterium]|nr:helicase-exonuclease AddAB subunit AddB [Clostridia bacterium]
MGLRIVYGKAGCGKSSFIYDEINKRIKNKENKKIYIITPEQFSFTAEQKLMEGKKSIINAEVITFNRLAYRVINEIGGVTSTNLSKSGKAMLIYSILQQLKNDLVFLNKSNENIDLSMRVITELKKHGIKPQDLKNEQENVQDRYLKSKLNDITLIYENFEGKIANKYIDETDLLTILAQNVDKVNLLKNAIIYIDEFAGFTEQEYSAIKKIIEISDEVTITSCIDNLDFNTDPNTDIFYQNKITVKKIIDLNESKEIKYIKLDNLHRFKNEELIYIENFLYNKKSKTYEKKPENINLFLAKNEYSEIENVAKQITKLVKEQNIRYKDISIITKNIEKYSNLTKAIFKKYEIPIFIDEKRDLSQNIIIQYVISILEIFIKNYSYESVFNYLKTGFVEFEENDIFKLEKYCLKYGIKNNKFKNDFIYGINENNKPDIDYFNEIRRNIINPLIELKNKINEEKNIKNIITQLYIFITNQNIEEKLNKKINKLKENNLLDLAKEYEESFKILINIFDEMILVFGEEEKITLEKFNEILKIGLRNSGLGKIPSMQDQVIMGDTDRSRSRKVKVVFIIGLNDGVFPSISRDEGFIDDKDRQTLKEDGIELAKGTLENLYDDNFNIYKAFTTSEEKLFLSYASSDGEGKTLRASSLIFKIKKIFPKLIEDSDIVSKDGNLEIVNEKKLYEDLILDINKIEKGENPEKLFFTIYEYYNKNERYKDLLKENINYINYNFNENINNINIEKLYGNNLNTSISKLEKYNSCPYSYFLQYILKLKEKEELKIQNIDTGTFMHDVINEFFEETSGKKIELINITDEDIEQIIEQIIDNKLLKNNNYVFTATAKYKLLIARLKRIILKALKYIIQTIVQSEFNIQGTEVEFDEKGKYKPIILNLDNGKKVEITGKIDRIDVAKDQDNNYVRIIDYKSSVKSLDFSDIYSGLQLQLITYLDAVCNEEDFVPAGILYFSLLEQIINSNKKLTEEEIEDKIRNNFKMKGLILADVKVAQMHDKNLDKGMSKMVPAYIDKSGDLSNRRSSIATMEEFTKLQAHINRTIKDIANEIFKGNIELKPYYKNKKTPCEYCSYKSMCSFNSGICKNNYRYIEKLTKDEVLDKI